MAGLRRAHMRRISSCLRFARRAVAGLTCEVSSVCARHPGVDCGAGGAGARDGRAAANGAFPESDAVLLPVDHPQQIVLVDELRSHHLGRRRHNAGSGRASAPRRRWRRPTRCGAPPGDRLYSLSLDVGLAVSDDVSCSWHRAGGALATAIATDYFPDPTDAAHVLAIAGRGGRGHRRGRRPRIDRRRRQLRRHAALRRARRATELLGVEIARADPRIIYLAIAAPGPHPVLARSADAGATLGDVRPPAVDRRAHRPHHRRGSGRRERHLPARHRRGRRAAGGQPRRRHELHDADHVDGRRAERVRAAGERHGAGRRPVPGDGGDDRGRGVALRRRRRDLRRLDADADAAPARARRARRHAVPRRQQLHATAGRWRCPATRAGRSSRSRATTRSARSRRASRPSARTCATSRPGADSGRPRSATHRPTAAARRGRGAAMPGSPTETSSGCGCSAPRHRARSRARHRAGRPRYGAAKCGETATPRNAVFVGAVTDRVPVGVPTLVVDEHDQAVGRVVLDVLAISVTVPPTA